MNPNRRTRAQLGDPLVDQLGIEFKLAVDVRRGDDVRRARGGRELKHPQALLQRLRPIVYAVQDVAMDVGEAHGVGSGQA